MSTKKHKKRKYHRCDVIGGIVTFRPTGSVYLIGDYFRGKENPMHCMRNLLRRAGKVRAMTGGAHHQ